MFSAVWVNPCFLDYRVPVYAILNSLLGGRLHIVFSGERTTQSIQQKIEGELDKNAVCMTDEWVFEIGTSKSDFANFGYRISYQPNLLSTIKKLRPDVIISEGFFQWTPIALLAKILLNVPLVIAYERTKHTERNAGRLRTLYRRFIALNASAICCNGSLSKEYCTDILKYPAERIVTGAMAADTEQLAAKCANITAQEIRLKYGILNISGPVCLYVGRLVRRKGLKELIAGWELYVQNHGSDCGYLVLVGEESPEQAALEEIVRTKKLSGVVFAGRVDYDNIASYYAMSDVFVIPTLEDNWSLVVPEAMACGKPVLCSQFNGCWPELIQHGINGWIFDPYKPEEIARYLAFCRDNFDKLHDMGQVSRQIIQDYSPQHAAEAVYKACLIALGRNTP